LKQGVALSVFSSILFATLYYYATVLHPLSGASIFAWRVVLAMPVLALLISRSRDWKVVHGIYGRLLKEKGLVLALAASGAMLGVQLLLFMWAPLHGYALDVSLGYFLLPLSMVVVGRVFYGERLTGFQKVAVTMAALGVAHELFRVGAVSWATALVVLGYPPYFMLRRWMRLDALSGFVLEMLVMTPVAIYLIVQWGPPALFAQAPQLWWLLPGLGLLSALAFAALMTSSRLLPMGLFGILSYVEPVLLFLVALLFLGEQFDSAQWLTYLPIWLAVLLVGWDSARLLLKQTRQGL
jgi:chloramphenicol-sensitive protein RarD